MILQWLDDSWPCLKSTLETLTTKPVLSASLAATRAQLNAYSGNEENGISIKWTKTEILTTSSFCCHIFSAKVITSDLTSYIPEHIAFEIFNIKNGNSIHFVSICVAKAENICTNGSFFVALVN